mmetsp:Transcript_6175/g.10760  ORF Transcript_6175/g.10760 Transcript_6175/m.10760 type:complete len:80 (-) Transcript_6175:250-489(-)
MRIALCGLAEFALEDYGRGAELAGDGDTHGAVRMLENRNVSPREPIRWTILVFVYRPPRMPAKSVLIVERAPSSRLFED